MGALLDRLRDDLPDRYELERELGSGGMATVFLARDRKLGRDVAVKVLRPELSSALGAERFLREVEIAARLHHPHILSLHDSGQAGEHLYFVMPYVQGESLAARVQREGELPVTDAVTILREVADALAYAHEQGIVHRDIKPHNVMLTGGHALVTDFGVAKAVSAAADQTRLTTAGMAIGSPTYMAPEQAAGDPNVDHRVDIYALGVMAYELLTGRPPFGGATAQQQLAAHIAEPPKPIREVRASVPEGLADTVMRCLEKRPADRWQSARAVVARLAETSGDLPATQVALKDTVPTEVYTLHEQVPRVRRRTGGLIMIGIAAVAFGSGYLLGKRGPRLETRLFTVEHLDSAEVRRAFRPFADAEGGLDFSMAGNVLTSRASTALLDQAAELLERIDVPPRMGRVRVLLLWSEEAVRRAGADGGYGLIPEADGEVASARSEALEDILAEEYGSVRHAVFSEALMTGEVNEEQSQVLGRGQVRYQLVTTLRAPSEAGASQARLLITLEEMLGGTDLARVYASEVAVPVGEWVIVGTLSGPAQGTERLVIATRVELL